LDEILPRWGAVSGGTSLSFTGENFNSANIADYSITIDNVDCPIDEVTTTEIKCTTGPRIGVWEEPPKLEMFVTGSGKVA
jgi:hypothetical protein